MDPDDQPEDADQPPSVEDTEHTPSSPPIFIDRHGDVKMGWKIVFLLFCLVTGPLGVSLWALFAWRGRKWNSQNGGTWREHLVAEHRSSPTPERGPGPEPETA